MSKCAPAFAQAVLLVQSSANMCASDRARYLFDNYRSASAGWQDAIVLALIGEVVSQRQIRDAGAITLDQRRASQSPSQRGLTG